MPKLHQPPDLTPLSVTCENISVLCMLCKPLVDLKMLSLNSLTTLWLDMRAVKSVPYLWPVVFLFSNLDGASITCWFSLTGFQWEVVHGRMISMSISRTSMGNINVNNEVQMNNSNNIHVMWNKSVQLAKKQKQMIMSENISTCYNIYLCHSNLFMVNCIFNKANSVYSYV